MQLKPFFLIPLLGISFMVCCQENAQTSLVSKKQISQLIDLLHKTETDEKIGEIIKGIVKNPDIYNEIWQNVLESDSSRWRLLKDLNIKFKVFDVPDTTLTALGLSYDFTWNYSHFVTRGSTRTAQAFGLAAKGNVAFRRQVNPNDFLETKVHYRFTLYSGGTMQTPDSAFFSEKNRIEDSLVNLKDVQSKEARAMWQRFGQGLQFSNQLFFDLAPQFGLESNQNFSKKQFTPGLTVSFGAKAWNDEKTLAKLNILDYPFALLRLLFQTDRRFTPYGTTLPTVQFGFDYVVPESDSERENLTGNQDPFPRFRFETGFRTFVSRIEKENIFFNANFRYYRELNAPEAIRLAQLHRQTYFVMALQSTSGFYASYSTGRLPFDAKDDQVYAIGFNYKF